MPSKYFVMGPNPIPRSTKATFKMLNKILESSKTVPQTALYRLRNNINVTEELCLEAVKQIWWTLQYVPEHLKTEKICLEAVKQYGYALYHVPEQLRTKQICLEAVKQYGYALRFVPEHLVEYVKQNLNIK